MKTFSIALLMLVLTVGGGAFFGYVIPITWVSTLVSFVWGFSVGCIGMSFLLKDL